jgi:hypothetical protein
MPGVLEDTRDPRPAAAPAEASLHGTGVHGERYAARWIVRRIAGCGLMQLAQKLRERPRLDRVEL